VLVAPHLSRRLSALSRGGEAHPPHIEGSVECGHLHHHGLTVTHGELPLHPS
jgi:hypothetical protein